MTPSSSRWRARAAATPRRLRNVWARVRPIPLPQYIPGPPQTGTGHPCDPYFPPTALTLGAAAMSEEATAAVTAVMDKLTYHPDLVAQIFLHRWGRGKFGKHWRFADLPTCLWAASTFVQPQSYLEIGVFRGRSAAVVGATAPGCAIYGFDLWVPDYAGLENPGPEFVRQELRAAGHEGEVTLVSGDSRQTVPAFLAEHPELFFDMITIDGAKTIPNVASDFASTLPRLKVGGVVLTDDLPLFPILRRIWDTNITRDPRYVSWHFSDGGFGISLAIRIGD